jgi:hypothetical protein
MADAGEAIAHTRTLRLEALAHACALNRHQPEHGRDEGKERRAHDADDRPDLCHVHEPNLHAPIVIGRTLPQLGDADQNARTDTPLIAWHEERAAATPGNRIFEYSVVWSNEDGGTDTPALMSRWGRTTDIEWIYRVELDAAGNRVAGTAVYQAPDHQTLAFTGTYEGDHPILQTCTVNNNMCDTVTPDAIRQPMGEGDNGAPTTITSINRAFFLDASYLPQQSTVTWTGSITLTAAQPTAVLWQQG